MPEVTGRLRTPRLASAPATPVVGEMYYDTALNKLFWWNGTTWVAAEGGAGATGSVAIEPWHNVGAAGEPAFATGWTNYPDSAPFFYEDLAFRKTPDGKVQFKGLIDAGAAAADGGIFVLPVGYRPSQYISVATTLYDGTFKATVIDIAPSGQVSVGNVPAPVSSIAWVTFNGIEFASDQATFPAGDVSDLSGGNTSLRSTNVGATSAATAAWLVLAMPTTWESKGAASTRFTIGSDRITINKDGIYAISATVDNVDSGVAVSRKIARICTTTSAVGSPYVCGDERNAVAGGFPGHALAVTAWFAAGTVITLQSYSASAHGRAVINFAIAEVVGPKGDPGGVDPLLPTGFLYESFSRMLGVSSSAAQSGRFVAAAIPVKAGQRITKAMLATSAGFTTISNHWVGLVAPDGTVLSKSADKGAEAWPASTPKTFTGLDYTPPADAIIYAGYVIVGSGGQIPQVNPGGLLYVDPKVWLASTQTAITTPASLTAPVVPSPTTQTPPWIALG